MAPLRVGDVLYGFCGGAFGRDSYGDKRVEAVGGDWVVVRMEEPHGGPDLFVGDPESLCEYRTPPPEAPEPAHLKGRGFDYHDGPFEPLG